MLPFDLWAENSQLKGLASHHEKGDTLPYNYNQLERLTACPHKCSTRNNISSIEISKSSKIKVNILIRDAGIQDPVSSLDEICQHCACGKNMSLQHILYMNRYGKFSHV
jgi:hypothetical protein